MIDIKNSNFVIFDLETTGLKSSEHQIIEIAAIKIDNQGNIIDKFESLVSLYKVDRLPEIIKSITKIEDQMLIDNGNDIDEVMDEFLEFIDDSILVAQNTKFDMSFLKQYYLYDNDMPFSRFNLDLINLSKFLYPNEKSYKLSKLVELYDVEYDSNSHHRAMYDVELTTDCFLKAWNKVSEGLDFNKLLNINKMYEMSMAQSNYLKKLMGDNNHYMHELDCFTKASASEHIQYYLDKEKL